MQQIRKVSLLCFACASLFLIAACAQDTPSLGDTARQARQKKQSKDAQGKDSSKASKVITNEELPSHTAPATHSSDARIREVSDLQSDGAGKIPAEQWKSQIQAQKNAVSSLQSEIDKLNDSIHYAPGNCVANCVQWNERQKEKQQQVEQMKAQLEDQKKRLEDMQDSARQQGYGSSVYDPD